jgi:hypothetical protein
MSKDWVVVATFSTALEAHIACARIKGEGVDCMAADEHSTAMFGGMLSGVKVLVADADVNKAKKVLDAPEEPPAAHAAEAGDDEPDLTWSKAGRLRCPECGSTNVWYSKYARNDWPIWLVPLWIFSFALVWFFLLLFPRRKWVCDDCLLEWDPEEYERNV